MGSEGARSLDRIASELFAAATDKNWMPTKTRARAREIAEELVTMAEDTRKRYYGHEDEDGQPYLDENGDKIGS